MGNRLLCVSRSSRPSSVWHDMSWIVPRPRAASSWFGAVGWFWLVLYQRVGDVAVPGLRKLAP